MFNAEMLQGTRLTGSLRARTLALNATTATALSATSVRVLWVIVQNIGTVSVYIGGSDVDKTGEKAGIIARPNGETPLIPVSNLNQLFAISASGTPNIVYLAGIAPSLASDEPS